LKLLVGKFFKSKKLLQILTFLDPQINFSRIRQSVRNPKLDVKIAKNILKIAKSNLSRAMRAPAVSLRQRLADMTMSRS